MQIGSFLSNYARIKQLSTQDIESSGGGALNFDNSSAVILAKVLAIQTDNTLDPGATPTLNDRYIITDASELNANFGTITGLENDDIVGFNGTEFIVFFDVSVELTLDKRAQTYSIAENNQYIYTNSWNPSVSKASVGLDNVDNTSDIDKPVSTAQQTALDLKANQADVSNVDNTSDANKPVSIAQQSALDLKVDDSQVGSANGVASLNGAGQVPSSQLPETGGLEYQGTWDAATNTPTLSTPEPSGHYYKVSVAGSTDLSGITDWKVGDWAISNGTAWEKIDNTESVSSVNGKVGIVVIDKDDVGLGNADNTSDINKPISTATQTALDLKANVSQLIDLASPTTWTAGNYDVTIGTEAFGISPIEVSYKAELGGGTEVNYKTLGSAAFGPVVLSADFVLINNLETNDVQQLRGIAFEPVGAAPPAFMLTEIMNANPNTGTADWNIGNADGLFYNFNGVTGNIQAGCTLSFGHRSFNDLAANTTTAQLGGGAVRTIHNSSTNKVDVYLEPSSSPVGNVFCKNLPVYADDAAAGVGGVPQDAIYKTATGELRIKL